VNHLELSSEQIRDYKQSWEAFVKEARQPFPKVVATLTAYGTKELVHSLQLVMQWPDERIEYTRSYHLLDGNFDKLTDAVMQELQDVGPNVKLLMIDEPLPVEHCACCGAGYSRTMKPAVVARHTDPDWAEHSSCAIYVNPETTLITMLFSLRKETLFFGTLHLCQGKFLHYHNEGVDERFEVGPRPSIRTQATRIVDAVLKSWSPARVFIGTGDPNKPQVINALVLPAFWENKHAPKRS